MIFLMSSNLLYRHWMLKLIRRRELVYLYLLVKISVSLVFRLMLVKVSVVSSVCRRSLITSLLYDKESLADQY